MHAPEWPRIFVLSQCKVRGRWIQSNGNALLQHWRGHYSFAPLQRSRIDCHWNVQLLPGLVLPVHHHVRSSGTFRCFPARNHNWTLCRLTLRNPLHLCVPNDVRIAKLLACGRCSDANQLCAYDVQFGGYYARNYPVNQFVHSDHLCGDCSQKCRQILHSISLRNFLKNQKYSTFERNSAFWKSVCESARTNVLPCGVSWSSLLRLGSAESSSDVKSRLSVAKQGRQVGGHPPKKVPQNINQTQRIHLALHSLKSRVSSV